MCCSRSQLTLIHFLLPHSFLSPSLYASAGDLPRLDAIFSQGIVGVALCLKCSTNTLLVTLCLNLVIRKELITLEVGVELTLALNNTHSATNNTKQEGVTDWNPQVVYGAAHFSSTAASEKSSRGSEKYRRVEDRPSTRPYGAVGEVGLRAGTVLANEKLVVKILVGKGNILLHVEKAEIRLKLSVGNEHRVGTVPVITDLAHVLERGHTMSIAAGHFLIFQTLCLFVFRYEREAFFLMLVLLLVECGVRKRRNPATGMPPFFFYFSLLL